MATAEIKTKLTADGSELTRALNQGIAKGADFRNQMRGIGQAIGAAFTVGAVTNFAIHLAKMGDDIQDAAGSLMLTTDEMQTFDALARRTAGGVEGLRAGIKKLSEVQADAREKGGAAAEAFDKLGMGADGYTASLADVLKATADYYARTGDLSTVQDLLGRSAVTTREALNDIAQQSLPDLIKGMKDAGLVIDEKGIKTLAKFNLMMEEGKIQAASFAVSVVEAFGKIAKVGQNQPKAETQAMMFMAPGAGMLPGIREAAAAAAAETAVVSPVKKATNAVVASMETMAESLDEVSDGAVQFAVEQLAATEAERMANRIREENADIFKFIMAMGEPAGPLSETGAQRFSDLRRMGANELGAGLPGRGQDKAQAMIDLLKKQVAETGKIPEAIKTIGNLFGVFI